MLDRLERAIERAVEGSIAGIFRLRVQPADIGRQLERAMLDRRATSVGTMLAPNLYQVRLHPEDAVAFAGWEDALCRELETWLADLAFARGLATVGPIRVRIAEDGAVARRSVRADATFSAVPPVPGRVVTMERARPIQLVPVDSGFSRLTVLDDSVTIGRAKDNDLRLADPAVSRHHARIEPDDAGWWVVDLDSRNGTWVNGAAVRRAAVDVGDEVSFGGVRFTIARA
jgi:hypothetical protein